MTKVVVKSLKAANARKKSDAVRTKQVKASDGRRIVMHTLDAESRTFGDDLTYVFAQNVKRARRENKRIVGAADRVPAKD